MVGNASWNFPGREVGDRSRKETAVFLWRPTKMTSGRIAWLEQVCKVSTIEYEPMGGIIGKIFSFLGFEMGADVEVIRYEELFKEKL